MRKNNDKTTWKIFAVMHGWCLFKCASTEQFAMFWVGNGNLYRLHRADDQAP